MNNRTLIFMTALVLVGMGVLLGLNLTNVFKGKPLGDTYINPNNVRGIEVKYQNTPYTLNFQQQNALIQFLNRSVPTMGISEGKRQNVDIQQIIIYQFQEPKEIILTPIAYVNQNLFFSAPLWNQNGVMMDVSEGGLKKLLDQTYDH